MIDVQTIQEELTNGTDKLRYHGNGFIQMKLTNNERIHVWHPEFPVRDNHTGTIHSHRFDISSNILLGTLVHTVYGSRRTNANLLDTHNNPPRNTHTSVALVN